MKILIILFVLSLNAQNLLLGALLDSLANKYGKKMVATAFL